MYTMERQQNNQHHPSSSQKSQRSLLTLSCSLLISLCGVFFTNLAVVQSFTVQNVNHFTTVNTSFCLMWNLTFRFQVTTSLQIAFLQDGTGEQLKPKRCDFHVRASRGHVKVRFKRQTCMTENYLEMKIQANKSYTYTDYRNGCEDWNSALFIEFHSVTKTAQFALVVRNFTVPYVIELDVTDDVSGDPRVEVQYASSRMGVLQSLRWHPKAGVKHRYMHIEQNNWHATVTIPSGHVMLLSFVYHFQQEGDCVSVRVKKSAGQQDVITTCGQEMPRHSFLLNQGELITEYKVGPYSKFSSFTPLPGYRLLFTIYLESDKPVKLPGERWNCSERWEGLHGLKPHFHCNLKTQCEDGRDEDGCGYPRCQEIGFQAGGRCYSLGWKDGSTHRQGDWLCQLEGGRLASLKHGEMIGDVLDIVWRRHPFYIKIGLTTTAMELPPMYRRTLVWMDNTFAHALTSRTGYNEYVAIKTVPCGYLGAYFAKDPVYYLRYEWTTTIILLECQRDGTRHPYFLCDLGSTSNKSQAEKPTVTEPQNVVFTSHILPCPASHWAHSFLACVTGSDCWAGAEVLYTFDSAAWGIPTFTSCPVPEVTTLPPSYQCLTGSLRVPYTFVCDHRQDCEDNSDEGFCFFPPCKGKGDLPCGSSKQCYSGSQYCDGQVDCVNEDDESYCTLAKGTGYAGETAPSPPAVVDFAKNGTITFTLFNTDSGDQQQGSVTCPETHYQCAGNGYCLPVFTICNGYYDCPDQEDEADCDSYACPGYYRCFGSKSCLHALQVCDGIYQCPRSEDELLCGLQCPLGCTCHGLAFTCGRPLSASQYPDLRYLDVRRTGMTLSQVRENVMLVYLSLAHCQIETVDNVTLSNLITLDLSHNKMAAVPFTLLFHLPKLRTLFLSGNPIRYVLATDVNTTQPFQHIHTLDLSLTHLLTLDQELVKIFPGVRKLNLSHCGTQRVTGPGLQPMVKLRTLDMVGCPMTGINRELLLGLNQLQTVYSDNYKLCCATSLVADTIDCRAPQDEISSCQDLLRSNLYRVILGVFNSLALLGNGVSFIFRLSSLRGSGSPGFSVFVLHLCLSDFLMGVYLTVIGLADRLYQNVYVWQDTAWRHSATCKIAGFLSLISCEVSAFIICLITLDRFLVVRFPLSFLHFKGWNAQLASCLSWAVGFVLSVVPLVPAAAHWQFYSQTGICVPLPVTRKQFAGRSYSFGIVIVLNFVLFLVIAAGQIAIYWSVQSNTLKGGQSTQRSQDSSIARRLFTVAMTDFFCWFPIGLLGLLASVGVPVSGEVNVAMAIIVMPLNSALNPFLYTLNLMLQKREKEKEVKLLKWLESKK